jgi:hypothetical protein
VNAAEREVAKARYAAALGRPFGTRNDFVTDLREAIQASRPLAAGRVGHTPQYLLATPFIDQTSLAPLVRRTLAERLRVNAEMHGGIFPSDEHSIEAFLPFFLQHTRNLDWLGMTLDQPQRELPVLNHYDLRGRLAYYQDFVPDRSVPNDDSRCFLPALAGRRLLVICPFARLLQARASEAVFEAVWAKTGKGWFHPATVEALELPYGFEPETQRRYGTAINLFEDIAGQMSQRSFDVAFIAAAGLAIPLAAAARQMGKIGIDLGGDLQILFGVIGTRWRSRPEWHQKYFTEAWIDMPPQYQPTVADVGQGRAYW